MPSLFGSRLIALNFRSLLPADTTRNPSSSSDRKRPASPLPSTSTPSATPTTLSTTTTPTSSTTSRANSSSSGGGGLKGAIAAQLAKKKKLTVLEKSSADWGNFVEEEQMEEELERHGKSKDAFLNKQEFLNRADYRRFEKERDLRQRGRKY